MYTGLIVVSYDGTEHGIGYMKFEVPFTIQVKNECRPSKFYIDDFSLPEKTLGFDGKQYGSQGDTAIVWTATDFIIERATQSVDYPAVPIGCP